MKGEHPFFESRLQRLSVPEFPSWGDAPGYDEGALSALTPNPKSTDPDLWSAEGAAFNDSLGHRPRFLIRSTSLALKARFIREVDG